MNVSIECLAQKDRSIQGTYEFPITSWFNDLTDSSNPACTWHWHEEIQFCVIQDGAVLFSLPEKQITLQPGQGLFINQNYVHKAQLIDKRGGYTCIDLNLNLIRSFIGSSIEAQIYSFLDPAKIDILTFSPHIPWQDEVIRQTAKIHADLSRGESGMEFIVTARLFRIFYEMIHNCSIPKDQSRLLTSSSREQLKTIIAYVQTHFTEKVTLAQISAQVHLSQCECCRIFKKAFGSTILSYVQECRVKKGCDLLLNSPFSISDIAFELGFCSTSYFIKTFRAYLDCTPGEYRASHSLSHGHGRQ